jgi:hypothetical protein
MGSTEPAVPVFSAPPETITFDGLLFDMDGTIIDSTDAVEKHWETWVRSRCCLEVSSAAWLTRLGIIQHRQGNRG